MKHKKVIIGAIILAAGVGAFILYNKKKKKDLAAKKPAAPAIPVTPAKTAGADGDDDEESNASGKSIVINGTVYRPAPLGRLTQREKLIKSGDLNKYGSWK